MEVSKNEQSNQVTDFENSNNSFNPRILIVEDDLTQIPLWETIIDHVAERAKIEWASSVKEADELIFDSYMEGRKYDLIISDIYLNGSLTGIDLWRRLSWKMDPNFLLVSGVDPLKLHQQLTGIKTPVYIQKPLNIEDSIETVYILLKKRKKGT